MAIIDKITYSLALPDGTTVAPLAGSMTLDETWSPYAQATVTIAAPTSLTAFDPRLPTPPRVGIIMRQSFNDPDTLAAYSGVLHSYSGMALSDISFAHIRLWNSGDYRAPITRSADLSIRGRTLKDDGTLELLLISDDQYLADYAPAGLLGVPDRSMSGVNYVLATVFAADPTLTADSIDADWSAYDAPYFPGLHEVFWQPGITADELLSPMLQAKSLRLWCDEARVWRVSTEPFNGPDSLIASALTGFSDDINRGDTFFNTVIIKNTWSDSSGSHLVIETATTGTGIQARTYVKEVPWSNVASGFVPPTGQAAYLLGRFTALGRSVSVTAASNVTAYPGQYLYLTMPDGTHLTGHVSAVSWDFESGEMTITPRDIA